MGLLLGCIPAFSFLRIPSRVTSGCYKVAGGTNKKHPTIGKVTKFLNEAVQRGERFGPGNRQFVSLLQEEPWRHFGGMGLTDSV